MNITLKFILKCTALALFALGLSGCIIEDHHHGPRRPVVVHHRPAPRTVVVHKPAPRTVVVHKPAPRTVVVHKPAPRRPAAVHKPAPRPGKPGHRH